MWVGPARVERARKFPHSYRAGVIVGCGLGGVGVTVIVGSIVGSGEIVGSGPGIDAVG